MLENRKSEGSRFIVDLGSVRLPALAEKQVETDIRGVVLKALAQSEWGGHARLSHRVFDWFPGRTLGLWLDPDLQVPWPTRGLGPEDHTVIIRQLMTYPFHVLRALKLSKGSPAPSGAEVLEAMLDVDEIDPFAKEKIKEVLKVLEQIEPEMTKPSREHKQAVSYVEKLIAGRPLPEQVRLLRDSSGRADLPQSDGVQQVLESVAKMMEDGASTIYDPDFGFYQTVGSGTTAVARDAVDTIKDADALGATGGGFAGTLIPGVGTAAGAAAGGAGASAGAAIVELIDWLF